MLFFLLIHNAVNVNFRILQVYFDKKKKNRNKQTSQANQRISSGDSARVKDKIKKKKNNQEEVVRVYPIEIICKKKVAIELKIINFI